jgi:hypothetical protein
MTVFLTLFQFKLNSSQRGFTKSKSILLPLSSFTRSS